MCGLFAVFAPEGGIDPSTVARAIEALRPRGPDGEGSWTSADGRVALAHTRLAIVDRAGGAQPIANEDGSVVAIVNGELYDDDDLRRELAARGHRFRSRCDAEVLVHLYEELGERALDRLRGEFAFVLWDARRDRLFAARDRFGVRPLCFARHRGALLVASEAKALFAAGVRAAWDREAFQFAATLQYPLPDRTLFASVSLLRAGHALVADGSSQRITRWWDLDLPHDRDDEPVDLIASLEDAVKTRLRADVEIAAHLSGGIDSSVVVALAMRHRAKPLPCFSVVFDQPEYDESALAAETAATLSATLHPVRVTDDDLVTHLPAAVKAGEGLAINGHIVGKWMLARAVRAAGYSVVLTGEGADEVLTGYAHFRNDLAPHDDLARTNRASAGIMMPAGDGLSVEGVRRLLGFVPTFLAAKATLGFRVHALLQPELRTCEPFEAIVHDLPRDQIERRHPVDVATYAWTRLALTGYILRTLGDGVEMAHAVESRLPYLDHHVFERARKIPFERRIVNGVEKAPLRTAMRGVLPDAVVDRRKHPFLAPPLARFGDALLQDTLRSRALPSFFDRRAVLAVLDRLATLDAESRTALDPALMLVLCSALLQEAFSL